MKNKTPKLLKERNHHSHQMSVEDIDVSLCSVSAITELRFILSCQLGCIPEPSGSDVAPLQPHTKVKMLLELPPDLISWVHPVLL